ncbi:DoxX family protein [Nocardia yamanashiensis]|uniref:DoxX family protein n=1 Tax=Nocardia yamanashiensis TaxID=209247 RepID=UPI000834DDB4|nr:MauE/DoxX family redox-associated membrane protein [Nocardia yamanashiensis]
MTTTATQSGRGRAFLLAAALLGAGATHFAAPKFYDALIPPELPGEPRTYTYVSGVAELGIGALVAVPRTRRLGARLAVLLLIAVFPGNVQMARDWLASDRPLPLKAGALLRLPLQVPMITTARKVASSAA